MHPARQPIEHFTLKGCIDQSSANHANAYVLQVLFIREYYLQAYSTQVDAMKGGRP